ncbi:hypothetical protein Pst134EA_015158 [Puccinia striiformis f. sp. tritici]|uniref:hypothetical protein n=1 Tax=Puccinia striiformis f. sp. tritici TaxID=168172 RepID=UPI000A1251D0|nr:hypothetical protein Pst134EA_015158 [Puccinia striiformis f. sp. tritici]KAH9463071.1 hypothetical protein Pst134EA_015158 [Puccinia striiformis f. sp. tritici]KAI9603119.1 hypothetical protein H4Q26_002432 [Puccinia striiformis f. sp. tritici PST-130]KAI9609837.1 hypothetical protein KEM48_002703 [Puccinia striiformis f. sp. tritici PST-130]
MPINQLGFLPVQKNSSSAQTLVDPNKTIFDHPAGSDLDNGEDSDNEDKPNKVIKEAKTKAKPTMKTNGQCGRHNGADFNIKPQKSPLSLLVINFSSGHLIFLVSKA